MAKIRPPKVTFKTLNLVLESKSDARKYAKMLAGGWELDHTINNTVLRGARYVFRKTS